MVIKTRLYFWNAFRQRWDIVERTGDNGILYRSMWQQAGYCTAIERYK